jgi:REP element-mobilizing transposase RayT
MAATRTAVHSIRQTLFSPVPACGARLARLDLVGRRFDPRAASIRSFAAQQWRRSDCTASCGGAALDIIQQTIEQQT